MKKSKIKHKCVGSIIIPVHTGMRAIAEIDGELVMTSKVIRIKKQNDRKIIFETENSFYEIFFLNDAANKAA